MDHCVVSCCFFIGWSVVVQQQPHWDHCVRATTKNITTIGHLSRGPTQNCTAWTRLDPYDSPRGNGLCNPNAVPCWNGLCPSARKHRLGSSVPPIHWERALNPELNWTVRTFLQIRAADTEGARGGISRCSRAPAGGGSQNKQQHSTHTLWKRNTRLLHSCYSGQLPRRYGLKSGVSLLRLFGSLSGILLLTRQLVGGLSEQLFIVWGAPSALFGSAVRPCAPYNPSLWRLGCSANGTDGDYTSQEQEDRRSGWCWGVEWSQCLRRKTGSV